MVKFEISPSKENLVDLIKTLKEPISQEELDKAEHIVLYFSMDITKEELEKGNLASLLPFVEKGIVSHCYERITYFDFVI